MEVRLLLSEPVLAPPLGSSLPTSIARVHGTPIEGLQARAARSARWRSVVGGSADSPQGSFFLGVLNGKSPRPISARRLFDSLSEDQQQQGVAQLRRAPVLGTGGRRFDSFRPDQFMVAMVYWHASRAVNARVLGSEPGGHPR